MHDITDGVHWHEPSGIRKAGLGEFKKQPTPYDAWMDSEGIRFFGVSEFRASQTYHYMIGSAEVAAATSSSSMERKQNGAATWLKCPRAVH